MCGHTLVKRRREAGYTLIELSIVMIVVGILVAPLFYVWDLQRKKQAIDTTEDNLAVVMDAIATYKYGFGVYPCPAPLDSGRGGPGYGIMTDCTDTSVPVGGYGGGNGNGFFIEQSPRAVDDGAGGTIPVQRVRRGAIPFLTLGLSEKFAYDGYGRLLTYAVTEQLATTIPNFVEESGGIDILDNNNNSVVDVNPANPLDPLAHFVVISHGPDGNGGYNRDGVQRPCTGLTTLDGENCNDAAGINGQFATYRSDLANTTNNAQQMDDSLVYFSMSSDQDPWQVSLNDNDDIHPRVNTGNQMIGVGTYGAVSQEGDVTGDLLVEDNVAGAPVEGEVQVNPGTPLNALQSDGTICPTTGTTDNCLDPTALVQGKDCPAGQVMYGISKNGPLCKDPDVACDPGQFITGFDANGVRICSPIPCQPVAVDVCGTGDFTLPLSYEGDTVWATGGDSRRERYRCRAGGRWELRTNEDADDDIRDDGNNNDGVIGVCSCTPGSTNSPVACPFQFTGTGTQTVTTVCPLGSRNVSVNLNACVCQEFDQNESRPCASGSGNIILTRHVRCVNNQHQYPAWTQDTSACVCPGTETETTPCRAFETGPGITRTYSVNCATGARTLTNTTGSCTCNNGATRNQTDPCPVNTTGTGQVFEYTYNCASGRWVKGNLVTDNCTPIPTPVGYSWQRLTSSPRFILQSCGGRPRIGDTCTSPSSTTECCKATGVYYHIHDCVCNP